MLSEIKTLRPAALIVWKTDRIARNRKDSMKYKTLIRESGCAIHYIAESLPDAEAETAFFEGILEASAEYYSLQLEIEVLYFCTTRCTTNTMVRKVTIVQRIGSHIYL